MKNPKKKPEWTVDKVLAQYWKEEAQFLASGLDSIYPRLRRINAFFGKDSKWNHINESRVAEFVSSLRREYRPIVKNYKDGRKELLKSTRLLDPRTINYILNTLGRIQTLAEKRWKIEPAEFDVNEHKLQVSDVNKSYFAPGDEQKIFDKLPECWKDAFRFCLWTGVRAQNVFVSSKGRVIRAVKRRDIFLEERIIRFYGKSRKPGGKINEVPMINEVYDMLVHKLKIESLAPDDFVFVYPEKHHLAGKPLGDYRAALYGAMDEAGFDRKIGEGMHLTRHTFVTRLVQGGADISIAQKAAGHADVKTTQIYAHRQMEQIREAMQNNVVQKSDDKN